MSGDDLKAKVANLSFQPDSVYNLIRHSILEGALDSPLAGSELVLRLVETSGKKIKTNHVQTYMSKFMECGVIRAVKPNGSNLNYYVLASVSREEALREIGKERRVLELEGQLFSADLSKRLSANFSTELRELQVNFGKCGNATAFLLRKILEKLLLVVFGKLDKMAAIEDKNRPGGWKGLQEMVDIAAAEKVGGMPVLLPKTAKEIRGIKFLGDTAAHNPFIDADMTTIIPQMPFIIAAFGELARHL
jgi:hypothetical protein